MSKVSVARFREAIHKRQMYRKNESGSSSASVSGRKRLYSDLEIEEVEEQAKEPEGDPLEYFNIMKQTWKVLQARGLSLYEDIQHNGYKHDDLEFLKNFFELDMSKADTTAIE